MKVLVIGSGGREHALAWKLRQSSQVDEVIVAPGNAGTAREPGVRNADVAMNDIDGLLALAKREKIGLTVVGPEVPLVAGVVDKFRAAGLRIFAAQASPARLRWRATSPGGRRRLARSHQGTGPPHAEEAQAESYVRPLKTYSFQIPEFVGGEKTLHRRSGADRTQRATYATFSRLEA